MIKKEGELLQALVLLALTQVTLFPIHQCFHRCHSHHDHCHCYVDKTDRLIIRLLFGFASSVFVKLNRNITPSSFPFPHLLVPHFHFLISISSFPFPHFHLFISISTFSFPQFNFLISISKVLFYLIGWLASPLLLLTAILLIGLNHDDYSDDDDGDDAEDDDVRREPTFSTCKLVMSSLRHYSHIH